MAKKTKYKISKKINHNDYVFLNVGGVRNIAQYFMDGLKGKIAIAYEDKYFGTDQCILKFIELNYYKLVKKSWLIKINKEKAEALLPLI